MFSGEVSRTGNRAHGRCSIPEAESERERRGHGAPQKQQPLGLYSPVAPLFKESAHARHDRLEADEPLPELGVEPVVRRALGQAIVKVVAVRHGSYGNLEIQRRWWGFACTW